MMSNNELWDNFRIRKPNRFRPAKLRESGSCDARKYLLRVLLDDFPWRLEIQTKSQKGARGFPRLEEMQLSETRQTIQFVNLR
jgi:hypothetical protein